MVYDSRILSLKRIQPWAFVFTACAFVLIPFSRSISPTGQNEERPFLSQLDSFHKLIECSDTNEVKKCLNYYKYDLIEESIIVLPFTRLSLENCLAKLDLTLNDNFQLINIQECFHKADRLETALKAKTTSRGSYWHGSPTFLLKVFIIQNLVILTLALKVLESFRQLVFKVDNLNDDERTKFKNASHLSEVPKKITTITKVQSVDNVAPCEVIKKNSNSGRLGGLRCPTNFTTKDDHMTQSYALEGKSHKVSGNPPYFPDSDTENGDVSEVANSRWDHNFCHKENINPSESVYLGERVEGDCSRTLKRRHVDSFDIATIEGRREWKAYIKENLSKDKPTGTKVPIQGSAGGYSPSNVIQIPAFVRNHPAPELRYKDIVKEGANKKKFRRVFVPGRGWVSHKRLEEEEAIYGTKSLVKRNNDKLAI